MLLLSVFFLQRRGAEPRIYFETFLAVFRALQLTFGEVAEAVGTLRGFPLQGGRRGLRGKWNLVSNELNILSLSSRKENLLVFCRAQTSALVPFVRLLRPHATASTAMSLSPLSCRTSAPLRLCVREKTSLRPSSITLLQKFNLSTFSRLLQPHALNVGCCD